MIDVYTNLDAGYMDEVSLRNAGIERKTEFKEKRIYKFEPPVCTVCCIFCDIILTQITEKSLE